MRNLVAILSTLITVIFSLATSANTSSASTGSDSMKTIEGSVWYRERMLLPPNAEVRVYLEDVSRMDVPADVIATTRFVPQGVPPWNFTLEYDPAKLHEKGRYGLRARIELDGRLMFFNTEHISAFDREPGTPAKIMVSQVGGRRGDGETSSSKPDAGLTNTYWKIVELNGQPATLGAGKKELHMFLTTEGSQVRGFSGCNRFRGTYELSDDQLQFGQMASTMMASVEGMEQEQQFLKAISNTKRFSIKGESLMLYSIEDQLILSFEAVYLR